MNSLNTQVNFSTEFVVPQSEAGLVTLLDLTTVLLFSLIPLRPGTNYAAYSL